MQIFVHPKVTMNVIEPRLVKVSNNVTYHPPVVDIRGQLDVVSGPNRWDVCIVILIKPVRNARVSHTARACTCLLLRGVRWWQPVCAHVARHQLHSSWLLPSRWLQVVEADAATKRDGEEERGEEDEDQRGQQDPDSAGTFHFASFLRHSSSSSTTSTSCRPDSTPAQPGPEVWESGGSPGWTTTPGPPAPAPVPVQGGGRDAAPPWPCPDPWACHCPQPAPSSSSAAASQQQPPRSSQGDWDDPLTSTRHHQIAHCSRLVNTRWQDNVSMSQFASQSSCVLCDDPTLPPSGSGPSLSSSAMRVSNKNVSAHTHTGGSDDLHTTVAPQLWKSFAFDVMMSPSVSLRPPFSPLLMSSIFTL